MPIYAYKCDACGFAKDVLQKMSDDPLTDCPSCGKADFKKQLTAAGFQLKGSGWYVTDFRGESGAGAAKAEAPGDTAASSPAGTPAATDSATSAPSTATPAAAAAAPAASPAASGSAPAASA